MANTAIANSEAKSACDEVVDALDSGAQGSLKIYDGSQPTNPDATTGGSSLLAELALNNPAFGAATDASPGGKATANTITDDTSANASGTATWFRAENSNGTAVIDGDVGTSTGADLTLGSVNISSGATVSVSTWTVTMPES